MKVRLIRGACVSALALFLFSTGAAHAQYNQFLVTVDTSQLQPLPNLDAYNLDFQLSGDQNSTVNISQLNLGGGGFAGPALTTGTATMPSDTTVNLIASNPISEVTRPLTTTGSQIQFVASLVPNPSVTGPDLFTFGLFDTTGQVTAGGSTSNGSDWLLAQINLTKPNYGTSDWITYNLSEPPTAFGYSVTVAPYSPPAVPETSSVVGFAMLCITVIGGRQLVRVHGRRYIERLGSI